jgi:hypothetical protein
VHEVFENVVKWELILRNPLDGMELPKLTKKAPKIVEKGSVIKLLERTSSTRLYALILLDLRTSARRGELLALQWPDINFSTGVMNVTKSLEQINKACASSPPNPKSRGVFSFRPQRFRHCTSTGPYRKKIGTYSAPTTRKMIWCSAGPMAVTTVPIALVRVSWK